MEVVQKMVHHEALVITQGGILQTMGHVVDEEFYMSFSLAGITHKLHEHAPNMFKLFHAFSTTRRQEYEIGEVGFQWKDPVSVTWITSQL